MKNSTKLIVSLFVCGLTLLSGCGTPSTSLPSELIWKSGSPEAINIIAPYAFTAGDSDNAEQDEQQWLDEMSARYGTNFNITHLTWKDGYNTDSDAYIQAVNVLKGEEEFSGLVYVNNFNNLQTAIENDTILPLEGLLADNPVWNSLPDDFKSTFEYQGHIYAIPTGVSRYLSSRYISNDALAQTGINVTDFDSLKAFAAAYTQKTGQSALYSYYLSELGDIFNAFGLYQNAAFPFGYDPTEDCILDFLTKDTAINALEYLRELYVCGALTITEDYKALDEHFNDGSCPTYYGSTNKEDCTRLLTLNKIYPRILNNRIDSFALTKSTSQPKETINLFVNMLFGSDQNYLDCWLGSSDNYILNSDSTITIKKKLNADGNYEFPCLPNLTGGLTDIFPYSDEKVFYSEGDKVNTDAAENYLLLEEMLQNQTAIIIPPIYSELISPAFELVEHDVWKMYQDCIKVAITNTNWTVLKVVEDYREDMLNMGGNAILDEMNAAIGKKTAYYYG